jgi:predicted Fe-Mo cluster-binding NifX family protein
MRIAVASDGTAIAHHFGRCPCFLVYQVDDGKVVGRETRPNVFTAHALGQCDHSHDHGHNHGHGPIVNALADCDLVLCYGMGWRAAQELQQSGIQAAIVGEEMTPDEAVRRHLAGELATGGDFCRCHEAKGEAHHEQVNRELPR